MLSTALPILLKQVSALFRLSHVNGIGHSTELSATSFLEN